ncbi:putative hexosaminidase D [Apostichopus japonicus]|uniref:beta-N-acetylhexosaminidase n=1 Tax=Stichopus japonicus TaxID=307972 RepID=A0A2G8K9D3_STIJA|nr:putative hexosaminidase D [Apostichopus japonicus]
MDLVEVTTDELYSESIQGLPGIQRWVHMDLKGAAPKLSYLLELLPKLKMWGATGLLMEYEDTFPFDGDLEVLRKPVESYNKSEIAELQSRASSLGLEYVPLAQTFGHLEFVLKQKEFKHLREVEDPACAAICPSHPGSLPLLKKMLTQMIEAHRELKYFHIGADEVMSLGQCQRCREKMAKSVNSSLADIYLDHVAQVLKFMKDEQPNLQLIMWDDMLRKIDASQIIEYKLGDLVDPMVWIYSSDVYNFQETVGKQGWNRFAKIFSHYWAASAFKGAFGGSLFLVPTGRHIQNHHLWLKEIHDNVPQTLKCKGIALTGWQRYQHFSPLCELLPAGLPSLVCNLRILQEGSFRRHMHMDISKQLGFSSLISLDMKMPRRKHDYNLEEVSPLSFPGSLIFQLVIIFSELLHVQADEVTPLHADLRLQKMHEVKEHMLVVMKSVYQEPTITEWITQRLMPMIQYVELHKGSSTAS